jgi:hypothetical protein
MLLILNPYPGFLFLHNPEQSGQSLPVKVNSKLRVKSGHFSGAN